MTNLNKESNSQIHIDVDTNNKEVDEKSEGQSLKSSLEQELKAIKKHYGFIYKVSEKYRNIKEESYTPCVVSIGPLHHGKSHLQAMEGCKLRCLKQLLDEFKSETDLKKLSDFANDQETMVRACYQDFKAKEFSKMILLDGIFIITLFLQDNPRLRKVAKHVSTTLSDNSWMASDVKHDMLLVENQLPFFFIESLLEQLDYRPPFPLENIFNYFKDVGITGRLEDKIPENPPLHLVDFLLILHTPASSVPEPGQSRDEQSPSPTDMNPGRSRDDQTLFGRGYSKLLNLYRRRISIPADVEPEQSHKFQYTKSTSELRQAGVCFETLSSKELLKVSFNKITGQLKLPQLTVTDTTETLFRNLIAFEQSQHQKYIASYIIFIDGLINTDMDVKLLVKHRIIDNKLGENQLVADMFNNLHKEVIKNRRHFYFADVCNDLNEYSKDFFHQFRSSCFKWKLILRNKYFNNPWSAISFIAATILVVLAIIQTACAVAELKDQMNNSPPRSSV